MDVQQDGGHAERHESERARVGGGVAQRGGDRPALAHRARAARPASSWLLVSHLSKPPLSVDAVRVARTHVAPARSIDAANLRSCITKRTQAKCRAAQRAGGVSRATAAHDRGDDLGTGRDAGPADYNDRERSSPRVPAMLEPRHRRHRRRTRGRAHPARSRRRCACGSWARPRSTCSTRSTTPRTPRPSSTAASGPRRRCAGRPATRCRGRTRRWASSPSPPASCCSATAPSAGGFPPSSPASSLLACVYPLARRLGLPPPWALHRPGLRRRRHPRHRAVAHRHARRLRRRVDRALHPARAALRPGRAPEALAGRCCGAAGGMAVGHQVVGRPCARRGRRSSSSSPGCCSERAARRAAEDDAAASRRLPLGAVARGASLAAVRRGSAGLRIVPVVAAAPRSSPSAVYVLSYAQYFAAGHTLADFAGAPAPGAVLQPPPQGHAHLRVAAPDLDRRLPPRVVLLRGRQDVPRRHRHRATPSSGGSRRSASSPRSSSRSCGARRCCCRRRSIVVVLYVPWFATTRTSFLYYMTPVAPFMAILVGRGAAACSPAASLPQRGWFADGRGGPATAVLWEPVGIARRLVLLDSCRGASARRSAGSAWASASSWRCRASSSLLSPRSRRWRPWWAWSSPARSSASPWRSCRSC